MVDWPPGIPLMKNPAAYQKVVLYQLCHHYNLQLQDLPPPEQGDPPPLHPPPPALHLVPTRSQAAAITLTGRPSFAPFHPCSVWQLFGGCRRESEMESLHVVL